MEKKAATKKETAPSGITRKGSNKENGEICST